MEAHVRAALQAIDAAVEATRSEPPFEITPQYAADVARVMQLPQNRHGADKSWVWRHR